MSVSPALAALAGKRILVVEDEYFLADDLRTALQQGGAVVVGPVNNLEEGMMLARRETLDGAILDVDLNGMMSFPIAELLAARDVPFVFATGYDATILSDQFRASAFVNKPFPNSAVLGSLIGLIHGRDDTQGEPARKHTWTPGDPERRIGLPDRRQN